MAEEKDLYASRHEQASRTRDRIFEAAFELFSEKGFGNVTIRDICKKAQIANGTFYLHYPSKHSILYDVYMRADEVFDKERVSERRDLDAAGKILELIRLQLSVISLFHMQSDAVKQLLVYQMESDNQYFLSEDRKFHTQIREAIEEGKEKGEIRRDISTHDICWRILRFSRGVLYDWCLHNCSYDIIGFGMHEMTFYLESFLLPTGQ